MGVPGFFAFLKKHGQNPISIRLKPEDSLLVDAKVLMYRILHGISVEEPNLVFELAQQIHTLTHVFQNVMFVNDGQQHNPLKSGTISRRQEAKERVKEATKRKWDDFVNQNTEQALEAFEKSQRNERCISNALAREVLELLKIVHGRDYIQAPGEADVVLAQLAHSYTYLVTEDSDLLIRGAPNVLRSFAYRNELYSAVDAQSALKINATQLKWLVCLSGCDYTRGLPGIGLVSALKIVQTCQTINDLLQTLQKSKNANRFPEHWQSELLAAIREFSSHEIVAKERHNCENDEICSQNAGDVGINNQKIFSACKMQFPTKEHCIFAREDDGE